MKKTIIVYDPKPSGKSAFGQALASVLGCTAVVDGWLHCDELQDGALHLTNAPLDSPPDFVTQMTFAQALRNIADATGTPDRDEYSSCLTIRQHVGYLIDAAGQVSDGVYSVPAPIIDSLRNQLNNGCNRYVCVKCNKEIDQVDAERVGLVFYCPGCLEMRQEETPPVPA